MSASNTEASRAEFAKGVRESHGWPMESISDANCCEVERREWLLWDRAWQASRKAALNESIARVAQCMGPRSGSETAIKELL